MSIRIACGNAAAVRLLQWRECCAHVPFSFISTVGLSLPPSGQLLRASVVDDTDDLRSRERASRLDVAVGNDLRAILAPLRSEGHLAGLNSRRVLALDVDKLSRQSYLEPGLGIKAIYGAVFGFFDGVLADSGSADLWNSSTWNPVGASVHAGPAIDRLAETGRDALFS